MLEKIIWKGKRKKSLFVTINLLLLLIIPNILPPVPAFCKETDETAIYKVINKLKDFYERRKPTQFLDLFSKRKFYNYISFKSAVENDFDLYRDIRLKRMSEHLYLSKTNAIYRAVWEKRYRNSLDSPFQKQRGLVTILLEKRAGRWWIVDLQGYPIFGTREATLPDLTVTHVWIMGGGRRIIGVIENIGPGEAKGFYVGFFAGNTLLGKAFVAKMNKGDTRNVGWVWTPDPGRRLSDIRVVADVTKTVNEIREDNNVGKIFIRPGDTSNCVDLTIVDRGLYFPTIIKPGSTVQIGQTVTKAPGGGIKTVKEGDKVRICVKFQNVGGLNATGVTVDVDYVTKYPDQTKIIQRKVYPQIPKGGETRFCFNWRVPRFKRNLSPKIRRYIQVVLDPDNTLPECNEGNNMAEQEIMIVSSTGPYDGILTVSNPAKAPNMPCPHASSKLTMTVTVEDRDLMNQNNVQVTIVSDYGGDKETFSLPRVSPGVFRGTAFPSCVNDGLSAPTPGDGVVDVGPAGGHVTVQYTDRRDSSGRTVVRARTVRYLP